MVAIMLDVKWLNVLRESTELQFDEAAVATVFSETAQEQKVFNIDTDEQIYRWEHGCQADSLIVTTAVIVVGEGVDLPAVLAALSLSPETRKR